VTALTSIVEFQANRIRLTFTTRQFVRLSFLTEALRVREETEDFGVLVIRGQLPGHAAVNR
jgi:hypothetical protein